MTKTRTGGCACGAVRYEATGEPIAQLHCQCRQCQMRSGAGHGSFAVFAGPDALTTTGTVKVWSAAGDSGKMKDTAFCPICGTPVFVTFPAAPGVAALHVGSLDDPERFEPSLATYTSRAPTWDHLDPALTTFAKMPPS